MRYFVFLFLILASCATPRLAQNQKSKKKTVTQSDSLLAQVDTTLVVIDTVTVDVGQVLIDSVIRYARKDTLTFIGVGDIMMGTNYPNTHRLPPNDGKDLLKEVYDTLASADITMGNLEGVLLDSGGVAKSCRNPDVCYVFRSPTRYVQNLTRAGFDIMSLANNHAGDFADGGRKSSMKTLDSAGINYAGLVSKPFVIFEKEGVTYGFAAFAPNTGCASINDIASARKTIAHLDSIADVVIVSFHGGAEGSKYEHVPRKHELFVGEDRGDVYAFAHAMIDTGADIIFGHGPHVTRAVEVYKKRFIAYSLGNFCTYGGFNLSGVNGLAPIIKVYTSPVGEFFQASIVPIYQTPLSPVRIDPSKKVIRRIKELTAEDFPDSIITISDDGWITYSTK
ncbi:MAG: CapA family protein [Cyclobacteriaceae bacterium]